MTGLTYPQRLRKRFCWKSDEFGTLRDFTRVFSDGEILAGLGEQLAQPLRSDLPDVLLGTEAHGWLVRPLVACELGVGFYTRMSVDMIWLGGSSAEPQDLTTWGAAFRSLFVVTASIVFIGPQ